MLRLRCLSCCWGFAFCFGILVGHVPHQVHVVTRAVPLAATPPTTITKVVSSMLPALWNQCLVGGAEEAFHVAFRAVVHLRAGLFQMVSFSISTVRSTMETSMVGTPESCQ